MAQSFWDHLLGRRRVLVKENQRVLYLWKGQIQDILGPGEHMLADRKDRLTLEWFDLADGAFRSSYEKALFAKRPALATDHLTVVRTGRTEMAIVEREDRVYQVLGPDTRQVYWTDAGPWTVTLVPLEEVPMVEAKTLRRLLEARQHQHVSVIAVPQGQVALLYVDGAYAGQLAEGTHGVWNAGRIIQHKLVDLKRQALEVLGQELLTRDRVTIRINLVAEYRVTDPVKAATLVKDFTDDLYRAMQFAIRKTLGPLTLDGILEKKGDLNAEATEAIRTEMAEIGVGVTAVTLKDVILPGEMRDILNKVVLAQKEAEANVIRRREETNATRSLLNTAKVMAENPVMLRLKELEALEALADKVGTLTIHNGTDGLMNDLVRLRDPA